MITEYWHLVRTASTPAERMTWCLIHQMMSKLSLTPLSMIPMTPSPTPQSLLGESVVDRSAAPSQAHVHEVLLVPIVPLHPSWV